MRHLMKKGKGVFRSLLKLYLRKEKKLASPEREAVKGVLEDLQSALLSKDKLRIKKAASEATLIQKRYLKRTLFDIIRDSVVSLALILIVVTLIRTMWFEVYEIPSGSMRPTLQEQDRLLVSKTTFGINVPLSRSHFYFDPDLVKRNGIFIFTGMGMDISDLKTVYFFLFPGTKQYIKRLMGKPGDTLYFYGGKIYGIDEQRHDISEELQAASLSKIDHVPYIHMNGKSILGTRSGGLVSSVTLKQMNEPIASLELTPQNKVIGNLLSPFAENNLDYYDIWGFKNYGMGRLLTPDEATKYTTTPLSQVEPAELYLEIIHHPTVKHPSIVRGYHGELQPACGTNSCLIPLNEEHMKALFESMYTARFTVKNGVCHRYGMSIKGDHYCHYCPKLTGVPDGTYEIYHGIGHQILWSGISKKLSSDHPLMRYSAPRLQLLYNLGIEWNTLFAPQSKNPFLLPSRFVYFNEGSLYSMGAPFISKGDPILTKFLERETLKKSAAPSYAPYIPFEDAGPPQTDDGKLDISFIEKHGFKVPAGHYLALGDNYAMSLDSREFGCVPASNVRGAPVLIYWPPGKRMGLLPQADYPFWNLPRTLVWTVVLISVIAQRIYERKKYSINNRIP